MTRSTDSDERPQWTDLDVSRYDLVLSVIPLSFVLGWVATGVLSVSTAEAMGIGAVLGGLAVLDALFVHPPTGGDAGQ